MDSRISARALGAAIGGWRTREPAYEALADSIRVLTLDGRLASHTALPAERELAGALGLSRSTVAAAYRSLRASGHIDSVRGSGSVTLPLPARGPGRVAPARGAIDLQQASPAAWPGLAGVLAETAADAASIIARPGYDLYGAPALRDAIAARYAERGLPTRPDEILVTTGAQSAIHLLAAVLVGRGDRVLIETPTYPHAAEALRQAGGRLVGVPVGVERGWDLDRYDQACQRARPVAAYLMPDFQNPTGRSMTALEQQLITAASERVGAMLIVDETTGELAIEARPDAISLPQAQVRIGSLGKTVWGGLRIGWIRAESALVRRLAAARPARDLGTPEFEQAVAARLIEAMPAVLAQRAALLREGRDQLVAGLREKLPTWRVPTVTGGVSVWVDLGAPLSAGLVLAARSDGVYLSAGSRFGVDGGHDAKLRVPFTAPAPDLARAVDVLADVWPRVHADAPAAAVELFDQVV